MTTKAAARDLGGDVHIIDTRIGGQPRTTGAFVVLGDEPCLVETGPARSAPAIITELTELGIGPHDLATIAVTHVHLDHSGGVGDLARAYPRARIAVHPAGARHLADPTRLMSSAQRVFGAQLDILFGPLRAVDADRIVSLDDDADLRLGGARTLRALHTPGHARHHISYLDTATGDLYTGDSAGMYVPETHTYKPTTPPPDFDLALARASLRRMRDQDPQRLLFTHYGPGPDAAEGLDRAESEMLAWTRTVRDVAGTRTDTEAVVAEAVRHLRGRYPRLVNERELERRWEELSSTHANVSGIAHWLGRATPEETATV
ncbi:MBL fold metallo-hydrolase [Streptomyces sp. Lzd4kr]|nr:MBL fold metallo-hydrolase [Streptomyces sp. Lzd4kr]